MPALYMVLCKCNEYELDLLRTNEHYKILRLDNCEIDVGIGLAKVLKLSIS